MKKTLIINIGNSIIHIEEEAYETLTNYLNEIKQHFAKSVDDFEIVTDIENRIAEMLNEILHSSQRQVSEIADVQSVITQMGRVQDFETEETTTETNQHHSEFGGDKKLFRDTEEGVIAGVCAGLGHYFNIEARWIRVVAFLTVLIGGSGIFAYLIIWIAMPRASTRAQKMEMKGEATNLHNYKRSFEEELATFKQNMDQFDPYVKISGNFINETVNAFGAVLGKTLRIFTKAIAILLILFGFIGLVSLVVALSIFLGISNANPFDFFPLSIITENVRDEVTLAAFVSCFIPLLVLILFAIRVAFNKKALNRTTSFALLIIWLIGIGATGYYAAKISSEFQEHAELIKTDDLKYYKTYIIDVDDTMGFSTQDSLDFFMTDSNFDGRVVVGDHDDHPFSAPRRVYFEIEKSDNGQTTITQNFQSQGKTFKQALANARNINYKYLQNDSLIILSPRLSLKQKATYRAQELRVTIKIPVGTHLMLHQNIYQELYLNHDCQDESSEESVYREWVMTEDGLMCKFDLTASKISEQENEKTIANLAKQIDKQKEIAEKLQRNRAEEVEKLTQRLEELKRQKNQTDVVTQQ